MFKIISTPSGKFQIKEVDQEGNSVRVLPQEFATEALAQEFMGEEEKKQPADAGAEGSESAPSSPEEKTPGEGEGEQAA